MAHSIRRRAAGFNLIELIAVIVILGIVTSIAGVGIVEAVKSYRKTVDRSELADMADGALRRIARDLRYSLPMSTRAGSSGGSVFVETIVTKNGGRYRKGGTELSAGGSLIESTLGSMVADTEFESLSALSEPPGQIAVAGDYIVTRNITPLATDTVGNAYTRGDAATYCASSTSSNCNTAVIGSINRAIANTTVITFSDSGGRALIASSNQQFYVLSSTPAVTYVCTPGVSGDGLNGTGTLKLYYNYSLSLAQPVNVSAAPLATAKVAALADYVSACSAYANPEGGYAFMRIDLRRDGETMSLYHEMQLPKN